MPTRAIQTAAASLFSLLLLPRALCAPASAGADPLVLSQEDLRIEQRGDAGYHLFVRAKPGLGSVLLTESTQDPARRTDSYAYRTLTKNPINGDERRILNGAFIPPTSGQYFLVDSTPEPDPRFGSAYHVFIPWVVVWGYSWSRSGEVFLHDGTFVNIRAFAKPYADYSGAFADNPYVIRVTQAASSSRAAEPPPRSDSAAAAAAPAAAPSTPAPDAASASTPVPVSTAVSTPEPAGAPALNASAAASAGTFMPETVEAFSRIVGSSGRLLYAAKESDVPEAIDRVLAGYKGSDVDIVLCIDTTETMSGTLDAVKSRLPGLLSKRLDDFTSCRLGCVAYKDYFEEYLYKRFDFTHDASVFAQNLSLLRSGGGRDTPEAVYEALYAALNDFTWAAPRRVIVLVGDAPPHPLPRGSIDGQLVTETSSDLDVRIDAIVAPL